MTTQHEPLFLCAFEDKHTMDFALFLGVLSRVLILVSW